MARLGAAGAVVLPVLGAAVLLLALPSGSFGGSAGSLKTEDRVVVFSGGGEFGTSVALSRDGLTAIVGDPDSDRGKVIILTRSPRATSWRRFGLTGGAQKGSGFGTSVAISGNGKVALIGAPFDNRRKKGTAWIFIRSAGGGWIGQKLTARDEVGSAAFGFSVALSATGSTALVGGFADNRQKGAAWVFVRSGSTWRQQGNKLTGGREIGAGSFGMSVALSADGEAAFIGGPADRNRLGAAWFFLRSGSVWRQQSKLVPPSSVGRGTFLFGSDVALSANGRVALVGAPGLNTSRVGNAVTGAAWILTRSGADWRYRPRLDGGSVDYAFGRSVALSASGDTAAIGTSFRLLSKESYRDVGRAYLFSCSTLGCLSTRRGLAPGDVDNDGRDDSPPKFGRDVAVIDGADAVIVGAPGDPTLVGNPRKIKEPGTAWVFLSWPVVNSVTPFAGPEGGRTRVIVAGENFTKVRGVSFGAKPAVRYTVDSSTRITAVSPPGEGRVHVRVTTSVGISEEGRCTIFGCSRNLDFFRYVPRPTVTAIKPTSGPSAGSTEVTITGTNLAGGTVRFGARVAAVPVPSLSTTEIRAVSPSAPAGTVDVTVTTAGGTSAASTISRFTYVAPAAERSITFDDLDTGGPGGAGALVKVTSQYASQGLTFNDVSAIDYTKGTSALPGFARSGTVAVEHCVGVEFCTSPIRAVFGTPQRIVRVWVGFSFRLNEPVQVELRALDAASAVVGTATATLPANPSPTPIGIPLEVRLATASIARFEVSIPGGFNNALAVDDVTVEGG